MPGLGKVVEQPLDRWLVPAKDHPVVNGSGQFRLGGQDEAPEISNCLFSRKARRGPGLEPCLDLRKGCEEVLAFPVRRQVDSPSCAQVVPGAPGVDTDERQADIAEQFLQGVRFHEESAVAPASGAGQASTNTGFAGLGNAAGCRLVPGLESSVRAVPGEGVEARSGECTRNVLGIKRWGQDLARSRQCAVVVRGGIADADHAEPRVVVGQPDRERRLSRPRPTHRTGKPPHRPSNSRQGRPGRFGPRTPR